MIGENAILAELAENDGAILHWQVSNPPAYAAAFAAGAIRFESDCYVHPRAIANDDGTGWSMPEPCKHRDNGRGICCDCGEVL